MNRNCVSDNCSTPLIVNGFTKYYLSVADVKSILGVSKTTAYREIKRLNDELREKGYITVCGKIPTKYFMERLYC